MQLPKITSLHVIEVLFTSLVALAITTGLMHLYYKNKLAEPRPVEIQIQERIVERIPTNTLFNFTKEDLHQAMVNAYRFLSARQIDIIIDSIYSTSKKYNVDPLILYSICAVESGFRWWLTHDKIKVPNEQGKLVETHAIGLGGVVYEVWETKLKIAGIIDTKTDLYNPTTNIEAVGFIYNELKNRPLKEGSSHAAQSALIRYFGGNHQAYFKKIDEVIIQLFRTKFYEQENNNEHVSL